MPKKKRSSPVSAFGTKFDSALLQFSADFVKSTGFKHAASKGTEREKPVLEFFREHLPGRYGAVTGEAVDLFEAQSPQLDLMIYDQVESFAFYQGNSYILPAEALFASVEVKSVLSRKEIENSLRAARILRDLRPFKLPLAAAGSREELAKGQARFFHAIFAYDSDLAADNWMQREYGRVIDVGGDLGSDPGTIDRVYVVNRGMINTLSSIGFSDEVKTGNGFMHLFMDLLNFLLREHGRRGPVPYEDYAGKMTQGLVKLAARK